MASLTRAIILAAQYHDGQKDKGNQPYLFHPLRLMLNALSEDEQIIAVLHDTIEDTELTLERLREEGFSERIVEAVDALSRRKKESYENFILRIKQNSLARRVKILDLQDNMAPLRLRKKTDKDKDRLKKYSRALDTLLGGFPPSEAEEGNASKPSKEHTTNTASSTSDASEEQAKERAAAKAAEERTKEHTAAVAAEDSAERNAAIEAVGEPQAEAVTAEPAAEAAVTFAEPLLSAEAAVVPEEPVAEAKPKGRSDRRSRKKPAEDAAVPADSPAPSVSAAESARPGRRRKQPDPQAAVSAVQETAAAVDKPKAKRSRTKPTPDSAN
ncbi:hypothetical protein [Gorillibacterium sp. sgz500922]|uniref:hypothetical protein n=1 Tax=Gorillibacterium sp. sgz500922 TaxID=3446694 RepID=UPI003F673529